MTGALLTRNPTRTATRFGLVVVALVAATGCFTSTADFRQEAETFIVDDLAIPGEPDLSFSSATCEEPTRQEPGTVFGCTAIDNEGATWTFDVTIEEDNRILVSVDERP